MTKNIVGIIWMLIHALCAAILSMYYRLLSDSFDKLHLSFFYNFSAMLLVLPLIIVKRKQIMHSSFLFFHALRAAAYVVAQVLLIFVYNNMPFAQVAAITISYPLFTTVGAVIFLKERIGIHRLIALICGFIGAAVIIQPSPDTFNRYSLLAIVAIILWTLFDIVTNKIGRREDIWLQTLCLLLFMSLFSALPATAVPFVLQFNIGDILLFMCIGLVILLYALSAVLAVAEAEVNIVSPFYFSVLLASSVISHVVFGEAVELRTVVGSVIIVLSSVYIACREYQAKRVEKQLQKSRLI